MAYSTCLILLKQFVCKSQVIPAGLTSPLFNPTVVTNGMAAVTVIVHLLDDL